MGGILIAGWGKNVVLEHVTDDHLSTIYWKEAWKNIQDKMIEILSQ